MRLPWEFMRTDIVSVLLAGPSWACPPLSGSKTLVRRKDLRRESRAAAHFTTAPGKWPKVTPGVSVKGNRSSCLCTLLRGGHRTQMQRQQLRPYSAVVSQPAPVVVSQARVKPLHSPARQPLPAALSRGPGLQGAYLRQRVLGQLYLSEGLSSIGHVVAGSAPSCYLDHGGNTEKSDRAMGHGQEGKY